MTRLAPAIMRLLQRPEAERRLGSFFLLKPLGHGGFAPVWLAREGVGSAELRTAAVKLFPLDGTGEGFGQAGSAGRGLIVEEARALCKVEHPNVVRFYTLCVDEAAGVLGLAMEHVAGTPLNERIGAAGCLSVDETIRVGITIASALSAVHRAKLVHRDVKPSNIVEAAGVYKLIDFGIAAVEALNTPDPPRREARVADVECAETSANRSVQVGADATVRVVGFQSGTLGYIDPVCLATGAPASSASDLYALGATLFECLTGELPAAAAIPGTGQYQTSVLEGRAAPPALRSVVPDVPPPLADLVDSMIAPLRHIRPPSAEWVAMRLEEIRLDRHAEATWAVLERTRPEAARVAKMVLLTLTTPEGTRATRTMEEITALAGADAAQVVDSLSKAALIVAGGQGITLADDGLVTHWGRLREWLEAAREDRLLAEELERDAKRWLADADAVPLWQKRRLASAEELCRRGDVHISAGAVEFLRTSRRSERRARLGIAVAAVVVALSPVGAGFVHWKATAAQEIPKDPAATREMGSQRSVGQQFRTDETIPTRSAHSARTAENGDDAGASPQDPAVPRGSTSKSDRPPARTSPRPFPEPRKPPPSASATPTPVPEPVVW